LVVLREKGIKTDAVIEAAVQQAALDHLVGLVGC
jgi:hypothetical protein